MDTAGALVLGVIVLFALIMTFYAFTKRNFPISFMAAIGWLLLLIYTRANPLPNMATGSYGDQIVLWICILMMPILLFNGWIKYKADKTASKGKKVIYYNDAGDYVGRHEIPDNALTGRSLSKMSPEEYRVYLQEKRANDFTKS